MSGMKKLLSTGLLALLTTAYLTSSCSDELSGSIIDAKKTAFSNIFIEAYGQPDPLQTWGFGSSSTRGWSTTRAITPGDQAYTLTDQPASNPTAPIKPTFRSKPAKPTFSATVPTGTPVATSDTNLEEGGSYQISTGSLNQPQNTANLTFYVVDDLTWDAQVYNNGLGTTFIVTAGKTLTFNQTTANNVKIYMAPNSNLVIGDGVTFKEDGSMLYIGSGCTVTCGATVNFMAKYTVVNDGATSFTAWQLNIEEGSLFYNDGPLTAQTGIYVYNTYGNNDDMRYAELVNASTITSPNMYVESGGGMHTVSGATTTINGRTYLYNTNSFWWNDGTYSSEDFELNSIDHVWNTCKLTVHKSGNTGEFKIAGNSHTSFVLDANASVQTDKMYWGNNADFYMKNNSLLDVLGDCKSYNANKNHGLHGLGTGYSIFKAGSVTYYEKNQNCMNYYGNLWVDTDDHFEQELLDKDNLNEASDQPLYYFNTSNKTVMFKFLGDPCPITQSISSTGGCHHGYDIPESSGNYENINVQEIIDGRIFCEDLGSAQRTDIDYNDVVFDAQTYLTRTFRVPYTTGSDGKKKYEYSSKILVNTTYNKTDINLLAAGGTIDISVADEDVNAMMDIGKTTMANTYVAGVSPNNSGYTNFDNDISPVKFTVNNSNYTDLINIPICVRYGPEVSELTAYVGDTPQKLCAPMGSPWSPERVEMNTAYPGFAAWAGNRNQPEPWNNKNDVNLYNLVFSWNNTEGAIGGTIDLNGAEINSYGAIPVSGKGNNSGEEKFITITLYNDKVLKVGDQIAITGYRSKDTNAIGTLYFKFGNGYVYKDEQIYNNAYYSDKEISDIANTFIWTVTSDMEGSNTIQLSRNKASTNVFITNITIISGLGPQRTGTASGSGIGTGTETGGGETGGGSNEGAPDFGTITGNEVYSGKTTLSSGSGMTIEYSELNGAVSGDIYIYGTGTGSVEVNGAPTEDVTPGVASAPGFNFTRGFGFTRSAETPVVKKCTLGPKQLHGYDLGITGSNFTVYKVSYDATQPAVSQPTGNVLVSSASGIEMNWAQGGQQHISADKLTGIGEGTIIRVAGVGYADNTDASNNTSWQVELDEESSWTKIDAKTYWTENYATGALTLEFELDAEQAAALLESQLCVQGVNFILKYVTIDNSNVTPSGGGGGWSGTEALNWWPGKDIPASAFSGLAKDDKIRLSGEGQKGLQVQIFKTTDPNSSINVGWPRNSGSLIEVNNDDYDNNWNGYVEFTVSESILSDIVNNGINVRGDKFTLKEISIIKATN